MTETIRNRVGRLERALGAADWPPAMSLAALSAEEFDAALALALAATTPGDRANAMIDASRRSIVSKTIRRRIARLEGAVRSQTAQEPIPTISPGMSAKEAGAIYARCIREGPTPRPYTGPMIDLAEATRRYAATIGEGQ